MLKATWLALVLAGFIAGLTGCISVHETDHPVVVPEEHHDNP